MNDRILSADSKMLKRIYNIDANTYTDGALNARTKEMLGLVASMVLRCDDCIKYHIQKCHEQKLSEKEFIEVTEIATLVG